MVCGAPLVSRGQAAGSRAEPDLAWTSGSLGGRLCSTRARRGMLCGVLRRPAVPLFSAQLTGDSNVRARGPTATGHLCGCLLSAVAEPRAWPSPSTRGES